MVDKKGIEPSSTGCRPVILPLNDLPVLTHAYKMVAEVRFDRTSLAYETKLEPSPVYSASKLVKIASGLAGMEPGVRVELTSSVYKTGASPPHAYPADTLGASIGNRTQDRPPTIGCSAIELHRLEPKRGFELRSGRYERPVLPIELLRLERVRRIELRWPDWQSGAQPMSHTREAIGADGDNRNLFSGLEAQGTPYVPRPLVTYTSCQRTGRGPRIRTGSLLLPGQAG